MKKNILITIGILVCICAMCLIKYAPPILIHSEGVMVGEEMKSNQLYVKSTKTYSRNKFKHLIFFNWFRRETVGIMEVSEADGTIKESQFKEKFPWLWLDSVDNKNAGVDLIVIANDKRYGFCYLTR